MVRLSTRAIFGGVSLAQGFKPASHSWFEVPRLQPPSADDQCRNTKASPEFEVNRMFVTINSIVDLVPDPDRDISFAAIRYQIGASTRILVFGEFRRWRISFAFVEFHEKGGYR